MSAIGEDLTKCMSTAHALDGGDLTVAWFTARIDALEERAARKYGRMSAEAVARYRRDLEG